MSIFKRKWSRWTPITIYRYDSVEFLMMAKINKRTGLIKTKSIKMHGRLQYTQTLEFNNTFSANEQLIKLINEN